MGRCELFHLAPVEVCCVDKIFERFRAQLGAERVAQSVRAAEWLSVRAHQPCLALAGGKASLDHPGVRGSAPSRVRGTNAGGQPHAPGETKVTVSQLKNPDRTKRAA